MPALKAKECVETIFIHHHILIPDSSTLEGTVGMSVFSDVKGAL